MLWYISHGHLRGSLALDVSSTFALLPWTYPRGGRLAIEYDAFREYE